MKTKFFSAIAILLLSISIFADSSITIFEEDFEKYTTFGKLSDVSHLWEDFVPNYGNEIYIAKAVSNNTQGIAPQGRHANKKFNRVYSRIYFPHSSRYVLSFYARTNSASNNSGLGFSINSKDHGGGWYCNNGQWLFDVRSITGNPQAQFRSISCDHSKFAHLKIILDMENGTIFGSVNNGNETPKFSVDFQKVKLYGLVITEDNRFGGMEIDNILITAPVADFTFAKIKGNTVNLLELESSWGETDILFRNPLNNQSWQVGVSDVGLYFHEDKASAYRFVMKNGNVGIGTKNPTDALDLRGNLNVVGNAKISGGVDASHGIIKSNIRFGTPGKTWQAGVNQYGFFFHEDNVPAPSRYRLVMNNGRLGIGTKLPESDLHVNGDTKINGGVDASHGIIKSNIRFGTPGKTWQAGVNQYGFFFHEDNVPAPSRYRLVMNNGRLGIGTKLPESDLHVNGDTKINGNIRTHGHVHTQGNDVYFHTDSGDFFHGIGMYHKDRKFSNVDVNGPVVYGFNGGALGSADGGQKIALRWDNQRNVSVTGSLKVVGNVNANTLNLNGGGTIKRVYDDGRYSLEISSSNLHLNNMGISTKGRDVYFHKSASDFLHGIGMYHKDRKFSNMDVNGPVVYGFNGGALGSTSNSKKIALRWDSNQNVSIKGNLTTNKTLNANDVSTKSLNVTEKFDAKSLHIDKDGWIGMNTAPVKDFTLAVNGRIGIGVTKLADAATKLAVKGKITAEEVRIIKMDNWADFVFADDYSLLPIDELEQSIKRNRHLPDIPSEKQVKEKGIQLGEMQAKLLQKIEELTLYTIQQEKKIATVQEQKRQLEKRVQLLEKKWQMMEK
ncbi:hypothetical protein [Candidatus Uabimicrobium amorphum]|uniref:Peptidase S74 domain-containing protein n=1 Tax=Uabimicrobium amorphum TaxID=2596890 RepID=A0A5S9IRI7_UABAM|nr:hypothetical protein [Candidatus Uabimicrobium amorphum]BBM86296.1 hypothetical protein UABAM_04682 [Candidatus Uabimicrobium amorphum]